MNGTITNVPREFTVPGTPDAPTVSSASNTRLSVSWDETANTGPAITGYDLRYRSEEGTTWNSHGHSCTGTAASIVGLTADTAYQVQVRATNDEGTGDWSDSGMGTTDAPADQPATS